MINNFLLVLLENQNSMAIVWLCLGPSFLCLGSTHKKKENNTDDK